MKSSRSMPFAFGFLVLASLRLVAQPAPAPVAGLDDLVAQRFAAEKQRLETLYFDLHRTPELSFREKGTAARIAGVLKEAGFAVTTGVGGHGVVGILKNGDGPTLLLRTDIDALPVTEKTGLPYASKVRVKDADGKMVGVMHACGHDIHMVVFAGTARILSGLKERWRGTLVMIGQPAEERGAGARAMLADGLYERFPLPDAALALHCKPDMAAGRIGTCEGYALANVDMVDVLVKGIGGHGAYPHKSKDPIVLAARIVVALQTIVSREISPLEPAVVTVGSIHGGTKANIIPSSVKLELTCRSYSDAVRERILASIRRTVRGCAVAADFPESIHPVVSVRNESIPSTRNDPALTKRMHGVFARVLGKDAVRSVPPVMAGEDFGLYGRTRHEIPICLYWLGAVDPRLVALHKRSGKPMPPLHSPFFAPVPDPTIKTGVTTMVAGALELLGRR